MKNPAIMAIFHPQAWVSDNAIEVDPEGETIFDVTNAVLANLPEYINGDYELTDELKKLGPDWIQQWNGPFYIEIADKLEDYIANQTAIIEALQAELAVLKQAPLPPYDAIWRLTTTDEADAYNWVYVAEMDRQEVAAWLAAVRTPKAKP